MAEARKNPKNPDLPDVFDGLTPRQVTAVHALVLHPKIGEAASVAGVNEKTLWKWRQLPAFQDAYQKAKQMCFEHTLSTAIAVSETAILQVLSIMVDGSNNPGVRLDAAKMILQLAEDHHDRDLIVNRIEQLERELDIPLPSNNLRIAT